MIYEKSIHRMNMIRPYLERVLCRLQCGIKIFLLKRHYPGQILPCLTTFSSILTNFCNKKRNLTKKLFDQVNDIGRGISLFHIM